MEVAVDIAKAIVVNERVLICNKVDFVCCRLVTQAVLSHVRFILPWRVTQVLHEV